MTTSDDFDWADYLALAKDLASTGADESRLRSAVSRAYYAGYHEALRVMSGMDSGAYGSLANRTSGTHDRVWTWLGGRKERRLYSASQNGRRLMDKRVQADYKAGGRWDWAKEAQQAIRTAESIRSSLSAF